MPIAVGVPPLLGLGSATARALRLSPANTYRTVPDPGNQRISRERWDIARTYTNAYAPAVTVPIEIGGTTGGDNFGSYIISKMMAFETGQPQSLRGRAVVCEEIARIAGGRPAVVLTQLPVATLRKAMLRQGCGDVRIVHVPGGPAANAAFVLGR